MIVPVKAAILATLAVLFFFFLIAAAGTPM